MKPALYPATRGSRLGARAIDFALVFVASSLIYTLGWVVALANEAGPYVAVVMVGFTMVLPVVYETLVAPSLGKRLLGLRIVAPDGASMTRSRRLKRAALLWLPLEALIWGFVVLPNAIGSWFLLLWLAYLVYLAAMVVAGQQPLHDSIAGTDVGSIKEPSTSLEKPEAVPGKPSARARRYSRRR